LARAGAEEQVEPVGLNNFIVRLAENEADIEAAQRLRYRVFYEEMAAKPSPEVKLAGRDFDAYDPICDHLLVIDKDVKNGNLGVVGTYRLLRRSVAEQHGGFYTQQEYDISALLEGPGEFVELGRSCVDSSYRSRGIMQMLWRGLAAYVHEFNIDLMFGCASFPGTSPDEVGAQLSYLHYNHMAPQKLRPRALDQHYVFMGVVPQAGIDEQAVLADLPPLIKGYLRVGGFVGDGAVIDRQFNTTDVCVIVKTDQLTEKYDRRYRKAAAA
jgi:L-ornithine Nalpha-acyltransferase